MITFSLLNLRSHVENRPTLFLETYGLACLGVSHFCGKAKIRNSKFQILTNENVVEFQVTVADVQSMHVRNGRNNLLRKKVSTDVFGKATYLCDYVKKFVLAVLKSKELSAILLVRELHPD